MFMLESMSYSVKEGTIMNAIVAMQNIKHPKVAVIIGHAAEAMQPLDKRASSRSCHVEDPPTSDGKLKPYFCGQT